MRDDEPQALALIEIDSESDADTDDFFSDAPLDVESAVTGKTCNIFDPDCEACQ